MTSGIYAIKDKACGIVHVFTSPNDTAAKRTIAEIMNHAPGEIINRYSDDFDLLHLTEINTDTGLVKQDSPAFVCNLSELKRKD